MVRILSFFCFLLFSAAAHAQFTYLLEQTIPVRSTDGTTITMPWAGGLNATQYNSMDLDHDGTDDLVLFERMANKVIVFLRQNDRYINAPEYEAFFPDDLENWMLLRDFNCDGKKDLFTGDTGGIRVYENGTEAGAMPLWKPVLFYTGFSGPKSEVLLTKGFTAKINLQIQFDDLPSISDVDGDGDLDIFNLQFAANGTIEYHQNFGMERHGSCDSLDFERITRTWGDVRECSCGKFALHGDDCDSGGRTKHAGGKSLLALDVNQDQKTDLLFSEATCGQLYQLTNEGTIPAPVINTYSGFPGSTSGLNPLLYPAPYYEDVDDDGVKDLMVSTNLSSKPANFLNMDFAHSNRYYHNTGTNAAPVFEFVRNNFLQEHMIDVGDNAVPAFADFDGDGDEDLLISCGSTTRFVSTIVLYENTGSSSDPAFTFQTDDYLNFSFANFYNAKLQIVDINGDGTRDLVLTATDFSTGATRLYYIPNKSENALDFSGQSLIQADFSLSLNENLCLTDVDADGKTDILAGRSDGSLEYWKNNGQGGAFFSFVLQDESFIGLDASVLRINIACTVADLDMDGKPDLVYGDQSGVLKIIPDYRNAADATNPLTEIIYNPLLDTHTAQNLGGRVWPTTAHLFNTIKPLLVAGTILGGVRILKNENEFGIYPNPVSREDVLHLEVDEPTLLYIYSMSGAKIAGPILLEAEEDIQFKLPTLSPGLYVFRFVSDDLGGIGGATKSYSKKIMIK
jgi:hypothetical protein